MLASGDPGFVADGAPENGIEPGDEPGSWVAKIHGPGYLERDSDGCPIVRPAVVLSPNLLEASLDLRAPCGAEQPLVREELDRALEANGIVFGIDPKRIDTAWLIFTARGGLPRPMRVASGQAPQPGRPARLEYAIDLEQHVGRKDEQDGSVDFHELGTVRNVAAGQQIGVWYPAEESLPGRGLDGVELPVPDSDGSQDLRGGDKLRCVEQEDGSVILEAEIDGILVLENEVPAVSEIFLVPGDVGVETGNIDAEGSVVITGAVRPGFHVTARHDIEVQGVVEGSSLDAGGRVSIASGLIGDEETLVRAAGDVCIKYAQNARIECGGDVEILDADMGSTIDCSGHLRAITGRGRLCGGTYSAAQSIEATEIGSDLGAVTVLAAGANVLIEREWARITRQLDKDRDLRRKLKQTPEAKRPGGSGGGPDCSRNSKQLRELQKRERRLRSRLAELKKKAREPQQPAVIRARSRVHPGVEIVIGGSHLRLEETSGARVFSLDSATGHVGSRAA